MGGGRSVVPFARNPTCAASSAKVLAYRAGLGFEMSSSTRGSGAQHITKADAARLFRAYLLTACERNVNTWIPIDQGCLAALRALACVQDARSSCDYTWMGFLPNGAGLPLPCCYLEPAGFSRSFLRHCMLKGEPVDCTKAGAAAVNTGLWEPASHGSAPRRWLRLASAHPRFASCRVVTTSVQPTQLHRLCTTSVIPQRRQPLQALRHSCYSSLQAQTESSGYM